MVSPLAAALLEPRTESNGAGGGTRRRILVPEKLSPDGLALLQEQHDVDVRIGLSPAELIEVVSGYHALLVRSETRVTPEVLAAGKQLRVVGRAGVGVDNIDVAAATQHGVIVVNSPSGNIGAAAEHTIALLLATARNVGRADRLSKQGKWERGKLVGVELRGKVLGIVGLGKVGLKVARMAIGLGMKVVAVDPYASPDIAREAGVTLASSLDDILDTVDFLTIHTPLLATTLDLLSEKEFKRMKKTARVLNVARGGVYNEAALLKALDEGWIAGAGIDVFSEEPPSPGSPADGLMKHEKVVATPHLGASTVEAQENVSLDVCTQVLEILKGGLPTSAVNAPLILPEEYRKLQPYVQLVEKMGALYTQHYVGRKGGQVGGKRLELTYRGELASIGNTRPLFAALVKGLVSSISDTGGREVNIVNATIIAKQKGIVVTEIHARDDQDLAYASSVTLRATARSDAEEQQVIEGYASGGRIFISKLDRFNGNFEPSGNLLILHNWDAPGMIGRVGTVLGKQSINIMLMQVASLDLEGKMARARLREIGSSGTSTPANAEKEALMILSIEGKVTKEALTELQQSEGILDVSLLRL